MDPSGEISRDFVNANTMFSYPPPPPRVVFKLLYICCNVIMFRSGCAAACIRTLLLASVYDVRMRMAGIITVNNNNNTDYHLGVYLHQEALACTGIQVSHSTSHSLLVHPRCRGVTKRGRYSSLLRYAVACHRNLPSRVRDVVGRWMSG